MGAEYSQLVAFANSLHKAKDGMLDLKRQIIVGEGLYAVKQAKKICKEERIIKTGNLRNSFHTDPAPVVTDNLARIDVHNSAEYASWVEYPHLIVSRGEGSLFDRRRKALEEQKYTRGRFILTRAIYRTRDTQPMRIQRKLREYLERAFGGDGR